ncbi:capsular polysaccharide export protein, LipB/KpsS family [Cytobacillus sp. FSL H8-0458]|uniref:capsular polysaccharide export protein, LipB/KpsS family n=1 Tax=Cytobacillus sp. FSL H8-0458 TaxID=2975346 RepID=UPI0030F57E32
MANYLFVRGNRNKRFFANVAEELEKKGHKCFILKLELGELFFKSNVESVFTTNWTNKNEYPISDDELLSLQIYNITYIENILGKKVTKKQLSTYKKYMYFINSYIDDKKIDIICLFNGYHWIDQVTKYLAQKKGLMIYYFEDGLFRPYTITCDSKGINAASSVNKESDFYDSIIMDKKRLKKYLFKPENPQLFLNRKESLTKVALVKFLSMVGSFFKIHPRLYDHITLWQAIKYFIFKKTYHIRKDDQIALPDEYVFVPFQVSRDTQIFYNSPRIKTMEEFLFYVHKAVATYNKKHNRNIAILVKEHPEDMSRNNYKQLKKKYENVKEVTFIQKYSVNKLIKNSITVITINSTVGIEALAKNKPVITLGDALYNIDGIVEKCVNPNELYQSLFNSINIPFVKDRVEKFIYYLRFHYQVEGTLNIPNSQTAKNIADKIHEPINQG